MKKETKEEEIEEMELGEKEDDPYTEAGREVEREEDAITDNEEGFMKGYEKGSRQVVCTECKKVLGQDFLEGTFGNETYYFCSENCLKKFKRKHKK